MFSQFYILPQQGNKYFFSSNLLVYVKILSIIILFQNLRNLKNTRNFSNPKKPVRRPKQQSITWSPPNKNNNRSKENLHSHVHKQNSSGSSSSDYKKPQKQFNNNNNHNHQISNDSKKALRQPKPPKHSTNEGNKKNEKNGKTSNQDKHSSKPLLEEYFRKKNFGEVVFKIATMGNKGKERSRFNCYTCSTNTNQLF